MRALRKTFPLVREAAASVLPVEQLRYIALLHAEADEYGSLDKWLTVAPQSSPLCGTMASLVSINDLTDRESLTLSLDGKSISLGPHTLRWLDAPHLSHA